MTDRTANWEDSNKQNLECSYNVIGTVLGFLKMLFLFKCHSNSMIHLLLSLAYK